MGDEQATEPESTAVRVALWRALHVEIDPPPHVLEDEIGLQMVAPGDGWRTRPDMDPAGTRGFRASIVARARFIEDLVAEQAGRGVTQYVLLGAGLDTFAERRPEIASRMRVFEVDQPGPQAWKRQRLTELGFGVPDWLRLVPVNFEQNGSWWQELAVAGFDPGRPAVVASTGVSMYLSKDATAATLRQLAGLAPGSTLAMTFLLPVTCSATPIAPGSRRPTRARAHPERRLSASTHRRRCWPWRARPASPTCGTYPGHRSASATSPAAATASARHPGKTSWSPRPETVSGPLTGRPPCSGGRARPAPRGGDRLRDGSGRRCPGRIRGRSRGWSPLPGAGVRQAPAPGRPPCRRRPG